MAAGYRLQPQAGGMGAILEIDDFGALGHDPQAVAGLADLIDKHLVLHVKPQAPLTRQAVGDMAFTLGYPRNQPRPPRRAPTLLRPDPPEEGPPGYEFVADFGGKARPNLATPRVPAYIESLHYDGLSAYSVQAWIDTPPRAPNLWIGMHDAYRDLPRDLKRLVETRHALHAGMATTGTPLNELPAFDPAKATRLPLLVRHARTGAPLLRLPKNPSSLIEGMPEADGRDALHALWAHVNTAKTRYTAMPTKNELVIWDNMATAHTNPAFPRDIDRTYWFFTIPSKTAAVEQAVVRA